VGDINRDGHPEVVVGVGADVADMNHQGGVVAYTYDGQFLWRFTTQDHYPNDGYPEGVFASPALCDVDGDGDMEIAFGAWDQRIYLLDHNGNSLWNNKPAGFPGLGYYNADSIWSSAACADLNRDGYQEIITGADISGGGILPDGTHTQDGGFLYIFDKDGNVLVRRYLPEAIYASPAIGDLNRDGKLEIVSGTAWYWWNTHGRTEQPYVYAFDTSHVFDSSMFYSDSAKLPNLPGWPQLTNYPGFSSPALADLDGDGDLEIVIGTSDPFGGNDGIPGNGSVYAWHHTGQSVSGWPVHPKDQFNNNGPIYSSPTIADVDNDGTLEVLFSMIWDVQVYNANGSFQERLRTLWTIWASPAIGDTNNDGKVEVWIGGSKNDDSSHGYLWRFESSTLGIGSMPWPMFHRDRWHTGRYPSPPQLSVSPGAVYVLHQSGGPWNEFAYLTISNMGDVSLSWSVSSKPGNVTVTPSGGTVTTTTQAQISVGATVCTGWCNLGNIVIAGTSGGNPVLGSPATVPFYLYVGQVHKVNLPLVLRNAQ